MNENQEHALEEIEQFQQKDKHPGTGKHLIIPGTKYGRWKIISEVEGRKYKSSKNDKEFILRRVECRCSCGTIKEVFLHDISSGKSTSCGCYNREVLQSRTGKTMIEIHAESLVKQWMEYCGDKHPYPENYVYNLIYEVLQSRKSAGINENLDISYFKTILV